MTLKEYKPTELLNPYVLAYRIIESRDEVVNRVLPGNSLVMAFRLKGQVFYQNEGLLPATTLSGLRKKVRLINYTPNASTLVVQLRPTGATAFTKQPLNEFFEKSISLETIYSQPEIARVAEQLAETENDTLRIKIIEQFLLSRLTPHATDKLINKAIEKLQLSRGAIRIRELAKQLYISQDAFEKRFRKVVGSTAKQFSSIVRMKAIIQKNATASPFLDIALENGFYDQSHFNKEFKLFTGLTPTNFFKSASYW